MIINNSGGKSAKLIDGTATATGAPFTLNPATGYDGFSSVNVTGDSNLKAENIADGITIYGVEGRLPPAASTDIPSYYQSYVDFAKANLYTGEYANLFIAESNSIVTVDFMMSNFTVASYNSTTTEFTASGWFSCAYNKSTGTWITTDYRSTTSTGGNYIKNIRYCATKIFYNAVAIYPINDTSFFISTSFNSTYVIAPYAGGGILAGCNIASTLFNSYTEA